jgi:WD40 repeat protein
MSESPDQAGRASREQELADLLDRLVQAEDAERRRILSEIASRDPAQARELTELLAALPDPEQLTTGTRAASPDATDDDRFAGEPLVGDTLGGCVLESILGRGGVGTVFAARQLEPPRPIAIKILPVARTRPRDIERFRREANALARLEHPAIARIYASGIEFRGEVPLPYIVMELIPDARSIVEWARASGRPFAEIALAFAAVCDGMQQGHNRGVIHRDLKPSNILVDGGGRPRVIDFGVARLVTGDGESAQETIVGALLGTPAYMAPEQFDLPGSEIDARVDIHAIGLMLYESILGRRAYEVTRERAFDARRILRETEPPVPHRVDSHIPADLSAIVMKAMAKDRDRRYPSMSALAADLRAFAEGRAVSARAENRLEQFARLLRRNPVPSVALVVAIASLVVAVVLSTGALGVAERRSAAAELVIAMVAATEGNSREAITALERIETPTNPLIGGMIGRMLDGSLVEPFAPAIGHLIGGAISPDGSRWAAGGDAGTVLILDAKCRELGRAKMGDGSYWGLAFSIDGSRVYAGNWQGEVFEIDLAPLAGAVTGKPVQLPTRQIATVSGLVRGIVPSRDGTRLLVLSSPLVASTIELSTGTVRVDSSAAQQGMARALAWRGEGRAFAVGMGGNTAAFELSADGTPMRVDVPWLRNVVANPGAIALSRDGALLAIGDTLGDLEMVDAVTGARRFTLRVSHDVWSIDFSHDGTRFAVGDRGGRVSEFAVADGALVARHIAGSPEPAWSAAYASDGMLFANVGLTVTRFSSGGGWTLHPPRFPRGSPRATTVLDRDGSAPILRAAALDGSVWDLDIARGSWRQLPLDAPVAAGPACFDPSGSRLAAWGDSGIEIVPLDGGARTLVELVPRGRREIAWDPAGDQLAVVCLREVTVLRDDGAVVGRTTVDDSPGGHDIVYAATRQPIAFVRYGRFATIVPDGQQGLKAIAGKLPSCSRLIRLGSRWVFPMLGGRVRISHPGGASQIEESIEDFELDLVGHTDVAFAAAVTPDGRILATAGADTRIRFWDLARGELLVTAMICDESIRTLEWVDDGRALLVLDGKGKITLLDSVPMQTRVAQASTR